MLLCGDMGVLLSRLKFSLLRVALFALPAMTAMLSRTVLHGPCDHLVSVAFATLPIRKSPPS